MDRLSPSQWNAREAARVAVSLLGPVKGIAEGSREPRTPGLVSVVIPMCNAESVIAKCLESILQQTYAHIEVIVIDDASTDSSVEVVRRMAAQDSRIRLVRCLVNSGPYVAKNIGIQHSRGEFIAFQDADDWSTPERLSVQCSVFGRRPNVVACTVRYVRVSPSGEHVLNRGRYDRDCYAALMFRYNDVIPRMGYFDSVRKAADAEFFERLRVHFPRAAIEAIPDVHYFALARADSVSASDVALHVTPGATFLSDERQAYVDAFTAWHIDGKAPMMPFPLRMRPFAAPTNFVPEGFQPGMRVTGSIASYPPRRNSLPIAVRTLLGQVDHLFVHLNNYETPPKFLRHPRVTVTTSDSFGDLRDNGKFAAAEDFSEYAHLTFDDDLVYPDDYVDRVLSSLLQYGRQGVCGLHGVLLRDNSEDYFAPDNRIVHNYRHRLKSDTLCHVLGTGTTAYSPAHFSVSLRDLGTPGMVDLWVGLKAQVERRPMISIARPQGFLVTQDGSQSESLFEEGRRDSRPQNQVIRRLTKWELHEPPFLESGLDLVSSREWGES